MLRLVVPGFRVDNGGVRDDPGIYKAAQFELFLGRNVVQLDAGDDDPGVVRNGADEEGAFLLAMRRNQ